MRMQLRPQVMEPKNRYTLMDSPSTGQDQRHIYLVSCVAAKRSSPSKASVLYLSPLFTKAREYVNARLSPQDAWFILSAKYHLVSPDAIIEPYDQTLNTMPQRDRKEWAATVMEQLKPQLHAGDRGTCQ